ncbi:cathepsin L-like peptidase [Parasteatoda tepidariorum]|uniref:cathepsin L-like peptidase n=1 Tax=Parasteatoda tepidariorum TaxID=114398 RepID=UPI001C71DDF3|nr:procathepsin L-like [Parasteatoda tepidariorum]XP_042910065.1 procathepsin L-like [Parasteatoda tepidariorum]
MKFIALFVSFVVASANVPFNHQLDGQWVAFKTTFGKVYDGREELARRLIWEQKFAEVEHHNHLADFGFFTYRKGINKYSDLSSTEIVSRLNGFKSNYRQNGSGSNWVEPSNAYIPDEVDWREQGLVTPVKDQGDCGSCWAFSTTGSLEGQHKKKTGQLISLSEQNLVDCTWVYENNGCNGGWMDNAFKYIQDNLGIDTEVSYPYTANASLNCLFKKENVGANCTGYVDIGSGDEESLKKAVATVGPISVAIDASQPSFHSYQSGIYDEEFCSTSELDHAVLVVGYGTENGLDYWLVKNSWGTSWGMNGYIKMSRNRDNQCGIATKASFPSV